MILKLHMVKNDKAPVAVEITDKQFAGMKRRAKTHYTNLRGKAAVEAVVRDTLIVGLAGVVVKDGGKLDADLRSKATKALSRLAGVAVRIPA